jgi:hypothetical protein
LTIEVPYKEGRFARRCDGLDISRPTGKARPHIARAFFAHFYGRAAAPAAHNRADVFSIPEVAWVGLMAEQARTAGIDHEVGCYSFSANASQGPAWTSVPMPILAMREC